MADILHIVYSGTTIDFDDPASDFSLRWGGWAPNVADVLEQSLGNQEIISQVDEKLTLTIKGIDADDVMANIETLVGIVEQAELFYLGQSISPAFLRYIVTDSTIGGSGLAALIIGPPSSGPIITFPKTFDAIKTGLVAAPVVLRFRRHGRWYIGAEDQSDLAVAQNVIAAVTFTNDYRIPTPYSLSFDNMDGSAAPMEDCMILLSDSVAAGNLEYQDGTAGTKISGGNTFASQADAGNDARGGSVGRVTASTQVTTQLRYTLTTPILSQLLAVFAVVRVNNSTRTWTLYAHTESEWGHINGASRPKLVLDGADSTQPRVVFIGYIVGAVASDPHEDIFFNLEVDSISGSPTFDIDCVVALGMDRPYSRALTLLPTATITGLQEFSILSVPSNSIHPRITGLIAGPGNVFIGWRGDAFLNSTGTKWAGMILASRGAAWVWTNASGTPFAFDWELSRVASYLTPK